MSNKATNSSDYLQYLLKSWSARSANELTGLNQLRASAIDSVGTQRLPNKYDEEWRFTDISPLTRLTYPPSQQQSKLQFSDIDKFCLKNTTNRLVFVDNHYSPDLSNIADSQIQIIGNLHSLMSFHASTIESHLGHYAKFDHDIFTALNTAFLHDSALIIVPAKTCITEPIHLLFIASQQKSVVIHVL